MDTTIDTLADFLLARIAEDEAGARAALSLTEWAVTHPAPETPSLAPVVGTGLSYNAEAAQHIVRWRPSRILAECAAKRKIIESVSGWRHEVVEDGWYTCTAATEERDGGECIDDTRRDGVCDCGRDSRVRAILASLAQPFAAHPDFRPEWRL